MTGQVVLIAESDAVIALDLGETLTQAGYRVLGPAATAAEAVALLERQKPALAVIDIALRDGVCSGLIQKLHRGNIAFVVHTGCQRNAAFAAAMQDVPWIAKPAMPEDIVIVLTELSPPTVKLNQNRASTLVTPVAPIEQSAAWTNPLVHKLNGFAALSDMDRSLLQHISTRSQIVPARTDLAREGDKPDGVFLVLSGMACRHKLSDNGTRQITAYLVPGDFCDLDVALLDQMDHTITTISTCRVVRLGPEVIAELLTLHPRIARALRKSTLVDEATLREWLINVGRRSAIERLAHLFCELLLRLRAVGLASGNSFDLPLTQADLADTSGLSNVHVNRSLQELRQSGLIDFKNGRLTVNDFAQLKILGKFRPNYLHLRNQVAT